MSIEAKIATLKVIAALDGQISALEAELRNQETEAKKRDGERTALSERTHFLESSIGEMEKTRSQLTIEVRQMATQIDKAREKLSRCRNEREANAAQRELEELRRIQREREGEILKLGGLVDLARADLEKLVGQPAGAAETAAAEEGPDVKTRLADKRAERARAAADFDKAMLRRYDAVRARRGSGLAVVDKGTCTACHIALPPMVHQQMMHRKELFACPSCNRILYLPPLAAEGSSERESAEKGDPES